MADIIDMSSRIDELRNNLKDNSENSLTLGQAWIVDIEREFGSFIVCFDIYIKYLRLNREVSDVVNHWYEPDFKVRSHVVDFLRAYMKLIDLSDVSKCTDLRTSLEQMCKVTEHYTETMDTLNFLKCINEELWITSRFINPVVVDNNEYLQKAIFILAQQRVKFDYLVDEVNFFKAEATKIQNEWDVEHNSNLSIAKSIKSTARGKLNELEYYLPEAAKQKREEARELRELNRKNNSKPTKPIDINKNDSGDEDNSE
ncbi:hypothetical protein MA785_000816 [Vibrio parahaemolyticus]|nr:hypothetical protein [Vibrio parahaemolyticus]EJR2787925.1 hypothetical protein [Vibrio parahaemolyticus]